MTWSDVTYWGVVTGNLIACAANLTIMVRGIRITRTYTRAVQALTWCAVQSFLNGHSRTFEAWAHRFGSLQVNVRVRNRDWRDGQDDDE